MWDAVLAGPLGLPALLLLTLAALLVRAVPLLLLGAAAWTGWRALAPRRGDDPPPLAAASTRALGLRVIGVLLLVPPFALPVGAVAGKLLDAGWCGDARPLVEAAAPDGGTLARVTVWACGGAAGSLRTDLRLRRRWDAHELFAERLASFARPDDVVRLSWPDARTLLVEHHGALPGTPRTEWDGIRVVYRQVE